MSDFADGHAGRYVSQRECEFCHFTGPETEFMAFSRLDHGAVSLMALADGPEGSVPACVGCCALMGRISPDLMRGALDALLDRGSL